MTWLRLSRLCMTALVLLVCSTASATDDPVLLAPVSAPPLVPGGEWVVELEAIDPERAMRVMLERSPVGVELETHADGWTLRWNVPEHVSTAARIVVLAVDVNKPTRRQSMALLLSAVEQSGIMALNTLPPLGLPMLALQTLNTERPFSLWFRVEGREPDEGASVDVVDGPDDLSVTQRFGGWHELQWRPSAAQLGNHTVELLASSDNDPMRQVRTRWTFTVAPAGTQTRIPGQPAANSAAQVPTAPSPELPLEPPAAQSAPPLAAGQAVAPRFDEMSNLIVSAGRTVQFKVRPEVPEGQPAVVQIDRLPRNASFDENSDGSRTFHWMTSDRDQGEHRFRFTALNTQDSTLRDEHEVTIIVGDPTRGKTVPSQ